jgi:hypothetical protein
LCGWLFGVVGSYCEVKGIDEGGEDEVFGKSTVGLCGAEVDIGGTTLSVPTLTWKPLLVLLHDDSVVMVTSGWFVL